MFEAMLRSRAARQDMFAASITYKLTKLKLSKYSKCCSNLCCSLLLIGLTKSCGSTQSDLGR